MNREQADPDEIRSKLEEYATFIDKTLHPELKKAVSIREETEAEIAEYQELLDKLNMLQRRKDKGSQPQPLEALVDLGNKMAYSRAVTGDDLPKTVFVHVGMGFHPELTLEEAVSFIGKRLAFLQLQVLADRVKKSKKVAIHLESSLLILEELAKELAELEN